MLAIDGGCRCGAIRYRCKSRVLNSMICHCRSCRKITAAPVVAWVTFPRGEFAILQGTAIEFQSSQHVKRRFCGACGTHLTCENDQEPATLDITTCSLDEPEKFPPTHHSWLSHDVNWVRFGDGLPAFQQSRFS